MQEIIRFAWGISSLGEFLVGVSDQGLTVLEFARERRELVTSLRARYPELDFILDQEGLAGAVSEAIQVIENPGHDQGIPLDLRGTPYEVRVWRMLREIPSGETTSYGALAAKLGTRDAREVTEAIAANPIAILVPCHRVIKKDGSISGYRWGAGRKRALLAREKARILREAQV